MPINLPILMNRNSPQAIGLVGWWPMLFPGGTLLHNFSRSLDEGTITGATWTAGFDNAPALNYVNAGDVAAVSDSPTFSIETWTISAWINTSIAGGSDEGIIIKWNANLATPYPYFMSVDTTGFALVACYDGTNNPLATGSPAVNDGLWHLITGTRIKQSTMALYVDGIQRGTVTDNTTVATTNSLRTTFGGNDDTFLSQYTGKIRDVRIYNRAMSAAEVWEMYDPATRYQLYQAIGFQTFAGQAAQISEQGILYGRNYI